MSEALEPASGRKLVEVDWRPSNRKLRQFSAGATIACLVLAYWLSGRYGVNAWYIGIAIGASAALTAWLAPQALKPVYIGLTVVAMPIGIVVGFVVLAAAYFLVFVPVGLAMQAFGRDALRLKFDAKLPTYLTPKAPARDKLSYFRQS